MLETSEEGIVDPLQYSGASLVTQMIKNLPAMQETWIRSLGWGDPLEKGSLPNPVFWPGEFPGERSLAVYSPWGSQRVGYVWVTLTSLHI